ncbi:MAG TPA: T9SS type A sorting domain-containing protein [Chitinophagaceae bacterium]
MKSLLFIIVSFGVFHVHANQPPVVNAGPFKSIYLPLSTIQLNGSATDADGSIANYQWTKIAGPSSFSIADPNSAVTIVSNLTAGEYSFELTAVDAQGAMGKDTVTVIVYKTANTEVPAVGNFPNLMGANPGYYGNPWNDLQVYSLMANAGCRSTRSTVPMFFFSAYGDSIRYAEFSYFYNTLGFRENVFFLYNDATAPFPDRSAEFFNGEQAVIPEGLYLPIWNADGTVNTNNTFARYCSKVVNVYGAFSKYYEIWNEPDFTSNWGVASALPGVAGNWWENDPNPTDMLNVKAPVQYYIRMLRVAYEVIKRKQPDAIITLGGLGYPSFMHALLRNTDNPVPDAQGKRGSVTPEYPLQAGAYFDGLSFHSYPQYFLKFWDYSTNAMGYKRHSDEAIDQTVRDKESYQKILRTFGYGTVYPDKPVICTEINIPRKSLNNEIGGIEVQRNFAWKSVAKAARNNISQMYWFVTGEVVDYNSAAQSDAFKLMGLYENLLRDHPGNEKMTDEGRANKSAQMLLQDYLYDASTTNAMNIPGGIDGAAFRHPATGEIRFMLWAKTHTDNLENSQLYYSFPASMADRQLDVYKWNYCVTNTKVSTIQPTGILLTGEPVILVKNSLPATGQMLNAQRPVANAGRDTSINIPYITLNGSAFHPQNLSLSYYWDLIEMTGSQAEHPSLRNRNTAYPIILGLKKGVYTFRFTASDERGLFGTDTVIVAVDTVITFINNLPIAYAGADSTVFIPNPQVTLNSLGSIDPDGTIVNYLWTKISGPSPGIIVHSGSAATQVTGLVAGEYIFQLQVTDDRGAVGTDEVRIMVDALLRPNNAPVAKAGRDTVVFHPSGNLILSARGSYDTDGKIISYKWSQLSGPSVAEMINQNSASSTIKGLQPGTYVFQLQVADNLGATGTARVRIAVRPRSISIQSSGSAIYINIGDELKSPLHVRVYDTGGRLLKDLKLVNRSLTTSIRIDLDHLRTGLYFLRVTDASGKHLSQEFLKQ